MPKTAHPVRRNRFLSLLLLWIGIANLWRAWGYLRQRPLLIEYGATFPFLIAIIVFALFGMLFLWCGWSLRRADPSAPLAPRLSRTILLGLITFTLFRLLLPTDNTPLLYWHLLLIGIALWTTRANQRLRTSDSDKLIETNQPDKSTLPIS